jgi:hypothetical protein
VSSPTPGGTWKSSAVVAPWFPVGPAPRAGECGSPIRRPTADAVWRTVFPDQERVGEKLGQQSSAFRRERNAGDPRRTTPFDSRERNRDLRKRRNGIRESHHKDKHSPQSRYLLVHGRFLRLLNDISTVDVGQVVSGRDDPASSGLAGAPQARERPCQALREVQPVVNDSAAWEVEEVFGARFGTGSKAGRPPRFPCSRDPWDCRARNPRLETRRVDGSRIQQALMVSNKRD